MSTNDLWTTIKGKLANDRRLDQELYRTYIANSQFVMTKSDDLYLILRSQFGVKVAKQFVEPIQSLLKEEANYTPANFKVMTSKAFAQERVEVVDSPSFLSSEETITLKINKPSTKISDNKNYEFSFNHFVTGPSNKNAYKAAVAVVGSPGQWNPLFIYGPSGLGKTHLLNAIAYEFRLRYPHLKVLYLSSDDFARQVVCNIQKGHFEIEDFKMSINSYDALLIDDVQFLAKKDKTNEVLFTIFNHFAENGKQLVFSSDKLPEQLNGFDMRLITRFNQGLAIPIQSLDYNTARVITEHEFAQQNLIKKITSEVITYIAQYFANDVRKIKGLVNNINFWLMTTDQNEPFNLKMLQELFKDVPSTNMGEMNTKRIKEIVSDKYGVSIKLIDGKARIANVTKARHLAMYLTKDILGYSLSKIGGEFGGRDHTTVMSGINKVKKMIEDSGEFRKTVEGLRNKILS